MSSAEGMVPRSAAAVAAAVDAPATAATPPRRLFRKYALLFIGLVGAALLVTSGFDFWFSYQETKSPAPSATGEGDPRRPSASRRLSRRSNGRSAGRRTRNGPPRRLTSAVRTIFRLLRQVPAITEVKQLDAEGREQLKVSRLAMDFDRQRRGFFTGSRPSSEPRPIASGSARSISANSPSRMSRSRWRIRAATPGSHRRNQSQTDLGRHQRLEDRNRRVRLCRRQKGG